MTAALTKSVAGFHDAFAGVVDRWLEAVRRAPVEAKAEQHLSRRPVLPFSVAPPRLLDAGEVVAGMLKRLLLSPDKDMRNRVKQRLTRLAGELVTVSDRVMESLCDIVWELASRRVLILPGDRLDISVIGILASLGLANLAYACQHARRHPRSPLPRQVGQAIALPLQLATESEIPVPPGDLWLLDLIARSVRLAPPAGQLAAAQAQAPGLQSWDQILDRCRPRFVALSLVHKLLEADQLAPQLAQRCQYRVWPGLRQMVVDADMAGLRSLILGELAPSLVAESSVVTRGAAIRLLQALLELEEPQHHLRARLFIAQLFWEMLEQDAAALQPFFADRRYMQTLTAALQAVEEQPKDVPPESRRDLEVLAEIRACLRTYEHYGALVAILKPSLVPVGRSALEEVTTHE